MSLKLSSITLNTSHLEDMLNFYKILGFDFVEIKVDKGGAVQRAHLDELEFSIYSIQTSVQSPSLKLQLGFVVELIEEKVQQLSQIQNAMCILDPTEMPDGKKAIVLDPDGNAIELKEKLPF